MNRRAILAGLLAAALIVLAVILVSSGGRQDASSITGQTFRGEAGITRSVADLRSDQRYLDRHPEIERERSRRLAADEATREAADEGEAGEANPTEEDRGTEGGGEDPGEPAAREHASEATANAAEKPEPPAQER